MNNPKWINLAGTYDKEYFEFLEDFMMSVFQLPSRKERDKKVAYLNSITPKAPPTFGR